MKCPHCGRDIEFRKPVEVRLDKTNFTVQAEVKLPLEGKYLFGWYERRDPGVERPVLVLVSPHG